MVNDLETDKSKAVMSSVLVTHTHTHTHVEYVRLQIKWGPGVA
jgi:hypothetical protein